MLRPKIHQLLGGTGDGRSGSGPLYGGSDDGGGSNISPEVPHCCLSKKKDVGGVKMGLQQQQARLISVTRLFAILHSFSFIVLLNIMKTRKRSRSLTDLVPQPSLKQSKIEDFVLTLPLGLKTPAPFYLAAAGHLDPPTVEKLLAQQCFLVAETTASIQFQLDKIISTLNYLVSWATSGCPGLIARQPDAAAGSPCQASVKALVNSKQVALNINPINGNLPHWGLIQLVRSHILRLLGLEADDLKKVELLPSLVYCTRVLLSFDNPNTPKLFFRRGSLLRSFGILPRRVFKDMSIKPLLSNRQLVSVRRFTAPKRPSAAHINVPILNAIPDTRPLTNYTPIPVKPPDGVLSDSILTVPPTTVTFYQEASLDLINWEEMAPKETTPAQGTQGSLVNKPQASAFGIPSIYETDLPQDNFWNLEEIQLFDSFCALLQPERAQIIKCLDAVKSKLWSLSLPDKDPLGFQGVHTDLPAEAPLALIISGVSQPIQSGPNK
ncbi:hypothetical protein E2320_021123 [Naja naja]|nr:hypothetical protein E2320_021123 [Naja naja]